LNDELIVAAELGDEAKRFLESELGKKMLELASIEVITAQEMLERVDPTDAEAIRKLQYQAMFGRKFEEWLQELMTRGEQAISVYRQQNS